MKRMNVKQLMGAAAEWLIIIVVAAFLAMQSIEFWKFVTPAERPLFAWLGFGLTGGGMVAYLAIIMWRADTQLKKFVAVGMLAVCTIGELATAGFGIQIEGWRNAGFAFTETEFSTMTTVIQVLALLHAAAMIAFIAGDKLAEVFGDEDGDGVPNYRDRDYQRHNIPQNRPSQPQARPGATQGHRATSYASDTAKMDPTEAGEQD